MRILMVATPSVGHVFPVVPLAWALRAGGHEVLVATAGKSLAVAQAGLPVVDVAPGHDTGSIMREVIPEFVARMERARQQGDAGDRQPVRRMTGLREAADGFGRVSDFLADAVVGVAGAWRPDLVVSTQLDGAGMVAAAVLGVPLVMHGFGIARAAGVPERYQELMAPACARHGVATPPPLPAATIDIAPPSLVGGDVHGWSMRPVPYNGAGVVPTELLRVPAAAGAMAAGDGRWPRIAVTFGTVVPQMHGYGTVRAVVDTAAGLDVELVLALGDADPADLGTLPSNATAAGWLPLAALLPSCAAIIHHGGSGTTLAALDAAVPQLVVAAGGGDQTITAAAVAGRGAGLHVGDHEIDAALITQVVADPALRAAATEVRAEMRAMPAPATLVGRLEQLVAG